MRAFELRLPSRTYDEHELVHNLSLDRRNYEYVNLAASRYTAGLRISSRAVERRKDHEVARVVDRAASALARRTMMVYSTLVIAVVSVIAYLILKDRWTEVEPAAYLLFTAVPYALACILVSIGSKSVSFLPQHLYGAIRSREQRRLMEASQPARDVERLE